jgi:hypothetical protein
MRAESAQKMDARRGSPFQRYVPLDHSLEIWQDQLELRFQRKDYLDAIMTGSKRYADVEA